MDIIPAIGELNLIFQKAELDIAAVHPAVRGVLDTISKAMAGQSYYQKEFHTQKKDGNVTFKGVQLLHSMHSHAEAKEVRNEFCRILKKKIEDRFPNTTIVSKFSVMGMRPLTFLNQEEYERYGVEEIGELGDFFGTAKEGKSGPVDSLLDSESTKLEWQTAKRIVLNERYPRNNTRELWQTLATFHKETLPNISKLAMICLVLPLHTSDVERPFSVQNQVKTAVRNRIGAQMVNNYLTVGIEGPQLGEFDFETAAVHWRNAKLRKLFS